MNKPIGFQLTQLLGQHLSGSIGKLALQVGKAHRFLRQMP
jgi:hypothetical protein